jgi:hypothetical protein
MSQQQNKFLLGYGLVTVVGAGLLGYLCLGANSAHDEAVAQLQTKTDQVSKLRSAALFPKAENVDLKEKQVDAFSAEVDKLHTALVAYQRPLDQEIIPDTVSQKLGKYKLELETIAKGRGIAVPQGFDLGLGRHMTGAPLKEAAPQVDYVAESVNTLITDLFRNGITKLDSIVVPELPYEKDKTPPPPPPSDKDKNKKPARPSASARRDAKAAAGNKAAAEKLPALEETAVLTRYKIFVTFTGSEKSVQDSLNQISTIPTGGPFFVINNIRVENETKEGPQKGSAFNATPVTQTDAAPLPEGKAPPMIDTKYILGNEKITVYLDIDLIRFVDPEVSKNAEAPKAPAVK